MTATDHPTAEPHTHTHGPGCGHEAVVHEDHVDYLHDGHYDECANCVCEDCTCETCRHAA